MSEADGPIDPNEVRTTSDHVDITRLTAEGQGLVEATTAWVADVTVVLERINRRLSDLDAGDAQVERLGEALGLNELVRLADAVTEAAQSLLVPPPP